MNLLDRFVGWMSPERALRRSMARERLERLSRRQETYAAAKTDRMTGAWSPANSSINSVIGASAVPVRARVRQLVRDFPYFASAVDNIVAFTVGAGITFQSKVRTADGKLDKRRAQQIEDAFRFWADEADVAGKLHFYEMMDLGKRQDVECGEFLLVKRYRPKERRYIPYCLQAYEADWLTTRNDTGHQAGTAAATEIWQGVEYETSTGRVLAYHFTDPDGWGKPVRIAAEHIVHGFKTLRPGQIRGITPFAAGLLLARDLQEYMDAEIDAAKMAAKYLAFVKSESPIAGQLGVKTYGTGEDQQYIEEMENAIVEYLNPGESVEIAHNPRPGATFPPMVRLLLTMLAVTTGVPYEILSGDYLQINYSTSRTARNDFLHRLRPIIARHVRQWCQPVIVPFFDWAVTAGRIDLPGYFANPHPWRRCEWQPPGMESIDPAKETRAAVEGAKAHLRSPQEVIRARGRDPEEVLREIAEFKEMQADLGITPEEIPTSLKTNPAALDEQSKSAAHLTVIRR